MYKSKVVKNSIWMALQHCYSLLLSVLVSVLVVRYLGPEDYGRLEYVNSIISIIVVMCGLGLSNIMVRELTRQENLKGQILGSAVVLRFLVAAGVYIGLFFVCEYVEEDTIICMMLRIHGMYLLFQPILVFKEWFLKELNSKAFVLINIVALTVAGAYKVVLMCMGMDVRCFAFAQVAEGISLCVLVSIYLLVKSRVKISVKLRCMIDLLKRSRAYIISELSVIVYAQIDKIMLKEMMGEYGVGIYSSASYLSTYWQFVPVALISSASTVIIKKFEEKAKDYEKELKKLVLVITAICLVVLLALKLFGSSVIWFLYGESYRQAADYLIVLGGSVFFSMLGCIGSIWIVCNDVSRYSAYRTILGAVLNCILNYFLINKWGIMGAAVATLVTQFMSAVVFTFCFKRTRHIVYMFMEAYRDFFVHIGTKVCGLGKK